MSGRWLSVVINVYTSTDEVDFKVVGYIIGIESLKVIDEVGLKCETELGVQKLE